MSEQQAYNQGDSPQPVTQVEDVLADNDISLTETPLPPNNLRLVQGDDFSPPDSNPVPRHPGQDITDSNIGQPDRTPVQTTVGLFHQLLVWLTIVVLIISLWMLFDARSQISRLDENLRRLEISLKWLEDDQRNHNTQTRKELNHYQAQLNDLHRRLEHGGNNTGKSSEELEDRLTALENSLSKPSNKPGINTLKGKWVINIKSSDGPSESVQSVLARLKKDGIPASMTTVSIGDKAWHRVFIAGFGTYEDAKHYAEDVLAKYKLNKYWIRLSE